MVPMEELVVQRLLGLLQLRMPIQLKQELIYIGSEQNELSFDRELDLESNSPKEELEEQQPLDLEYHCIQPKELFVKQELLREFDSPMEELVEQLLLDLLSFHNLSKDLKIKQELLREFDFPMGELVVQQPLDWLQQVDNHPKVRSFA